MPKLTYENALTLRGYASASALDQNPILSQRFELHLRGIYKALTATSDDCMRDFSYETLGSIIELHDLGKFVGKGWKKELKPLKQFHGPNHAERSLRFATYYFDFVPPQISQGILYHGTRLHEHIEGSDKHAQYFMLLDALGNAYRPLLDFRALHNKNGETRERETKVGTRVKFISQNLIGKLDINWNAVHEWLQNNRIQL